MIDRAGDTLTASAPSRPQGLYSRPQGDWCDLWCVGVRRQSRIRKQCLKTTQKRLEGLSLLERKQRKEVRTYSSEHTDRNHRTVWETGIYEVIDNLGPKLSDPSDPPPNTPRCWSPML